MDTIHMQRSGSWYRLWWKDFLQVAPTLLAVGVGGLAVQVLLIVAHQWLNDINDIQQLVPVIACVAPVLFAIGSSGMLVGHERQSGSWEWSSSLPVSWRLALSSKLLVTLAGASLTAAVLAILPVVLLLTGQLIVDNTSLVVVYLSGLTLIALLEVIAYFFLATLLIRETLTALVIAGLGLCIIQVAIPQLSLWIATDRLVRQGLTPAFANILISYASSLGILLVGMLGMFVVFRWRWTTGQRSEFRTSPQALEFAAPTGAYAYSTAAAPHSWRVLIKLAVNSSFWLRVGAVSLCVLDSFLWWGSGIFLVLASGIVGLSAFEADQANHRYRFLADRGVAPWKIVVSRLGVAYLWMAGLWSFLIFFSSNFDAHDRTTPLVLCSLAFLVSALAAVCFRKPIVAATIAMVVFTYSLILYGIVLAYSVESLAQFGIAFDRELLSTLTLFWSPLAILILLASIFRAVRRWLIRDGLFLPRYFIGVVVLAWLVPVVAVFLSVFTLVPTWQWAQF